jgi:hypothetical protein
MSLVLLAGWIVAAALVVVGVFALILPQTLARHYGVAAEGHGAAGFVRATGIRDLALGGILAATVYYGNLPLIVVFAIAGIAVSCADLFIAWHHGHERRVRPAHAIHAGGIVAFILILAMALFAIGL